MTTTITPFVHETSADETSDIDLTKAAQKHLAGSPSKQVLAEILVKLREINPSWWSPEHLHRVFPAEMRMRWLAQRPDLRQAVTTVLTGLRENTARKKDPEQQASLIEDAIRDKDASLDQFELAFDPRALVVYGDACAIWAQLRERFPWDKSNKDHQILVADFIERFLSERSTLNGDLARAPILTHLKVRTAIDETVWERSIPPEIRVRINRARLEQEGVDDTIPFRAKDELLIATPEIIAAKIALKDLKPIFLLAEEAMGFAPAPEPDILSVPPEAADEDVLGDQLPKADAASDTAATAGSQDAAPALGIDAAWTDSDDHPDIAPASDVPETVELDMTEEDLANLEAAAESASRPPPEPQAPPLEELHKSAPGLDMGEITRMRPPKGPNRGSSLIGILKIQNELEPRLKAVGISIHDPGRYTVEEVGMLVALFETKVWPEETPEWKDAMIAFLVDADPEKFHREHLHELQFKPVQFKFLHALRDQSRSLSHDLRKTLEHKKVLTGPPPLPNAGTK